MTIEMLQGRFVVCKLPADSKPEHLGEFAFWGFTPSEVSLVCEKAAVPTDASDCSSDMAGMRIAGNLDLSLLGILARLTEVLAAAAIPVFAVSTYDTDYIFVPFDRLEDSRSALVEAEYKII